MAGNDPELARLKSELDSIQREIDQAKRRLDEINNSRNFIKSQIDSQNYKIADLKRTIDEEYQAVGLCRRAGNRYDADNHRYRAESFRDSLSREYDIKNDLYNQLNYYKSDYETALFNLRSAKERKQRVMEAFQSRLQFLKSQNEMEKAKWKVKYCRICGKEIRYHVDWSHIPDLCKECKDREKNKWKDVPCRICGRPVRYSIEWAHPPTICKDCKNKSHR